MCKKKKSYPDYGKSGVVIKVSANIMGLPQGCLPPLVHHVHA